MENVIKDSDKDNFIVKIKRKFKKGVDTYQLIPRGSSLIVGLSGGNDSYTLLDLLTQKEYIKSHNINIVAAHIKIKNIPYSADINYMQQFCNRRGVELFVEESAFNPATDRRKSPCFLCSWERRKKLFDIAKQQNVTLIATGHHQDDLLETLLLNMAFQGNFSTIPPKLKMDKFDMHLIRPMILITKSESDRYASQLEIPQMTKTCPYEVDTFRSNMQNIISQLEKLNPNVRSSMFSSLQNIKQDYLPQPIKKT